MYIQMHVYICKKKMTTTPSHHHNQRRHHHRRPSLPPSGLLLPSLRVTTNPTRITPPLPNDDNYLLPLLGCWPPSSLRAAAPRTVRFG